MEPLCTQGYGLKTFETLHTTMETSLWKWATMPSLGEAPLSWQWGSYGSKGKWMRGSVGVLRDKWSQGIHSGSITVCKGGMF